MPRDRKILWISLTVAVLLWFIDAYSAGFIEYYPASLRLSLGNHMFFVSLGWQGSLYYTMRLDGIYWFPSYHIGISLIFYPLLTTAFLTYAIFLTIEDTIKSLKRKPHKGLATGKLSFSIFISTITTGACCSLPIVYYLIALIFSASASLGVYIYLTYYSFMIDTLSAVFLLWVHRRNTVHVKTKLAFSIDRS